MEPGKNMLSQKSSKEYISAFYRREGGMNESSLSSHRPNFFLSGQEIKVYKYCTYKKYFRMEVNAALETTKRSERVVTRTESHVTSVPVLVSL